MKKRMLCLLLTATCLMGTLFVPTSADNTAAPDDATLTINRWERLFYEDHVDKTVADLTAKNSTATSDGRTPLGNLYDLNIVGTDHPTFSTFNTTSKNLQIQGNHAPENTSKNLFVLDTNKADKVPGQGMITVIPADAMEGLDEFTVSYLIRTHKPNGGAAGLVLFYDNAVTENGTAYFGGYDKYTFTGYTGNYLNTYAAYAVYGDRTNFPVAPMDTVHRNEDSGDASNDTIYTKVHAVRGEYTVDGVTYTAKIESYSDDKPVATSYAQWAEAPVFFYYETTEARWSVQFTNIELCGMVPVEAPVSKLLAEASPASIDGTAVRYDGVDGLRIFAGVKKDDLFAKADSREVGAVLVDAAHYTGTLTVNTSGALVRTSDKAYKDTDEALVTALDFEAPDIDGDTAYMACAFVKYTFSGQDFYDYSAAEPVSCARTAAKVASKYASISATKDWEDSMLTKLTDISGTLSTYKVLGSNILTPGANQNDPGWQLRMEALVNMLRDTEPDVAGFSEVSDRAGADQWTALTEHARIAERYASFYSPSDPLQSGGSGEEGLGIIYRKDKFDLVSSGTKYLSDTPDSPRLSEEERKKNAEALAANPGSTRYYPRKMVYVVLRDKATGVVFAAVNTHLTHASVDPDFSMILRERQAEILMSLCTDGTVFDKGTPFVVFGDMNAKTNSDQYNVFLKDGRAVDVRYAADKAPAGTQGTYHAMTGGNTFIDHMFMSADDFYAREYRILTEQYPSATAGERIHYSDHYAILGEVTVLP